MGAFCEFWLGEPQSPKDSANLEFPTYFKLKFSLNVTFRYTVK
ncbi:hypothetical protein [Campylobacter sp.]|nr:hypothetical protein [Campylobacter sp.]MDY4802573.1 hypothetical protein [Campylobacter sp.]